MNTTNARYFFIVGKGEVRISTGDYCMNRVARAKVIALCQANSIPAREIHVSLCEVHGADNAFLTGTFGAQTLAADIDGKDIRAGDRPMIARIQPLYGVLVHRHVSEVS